MRRDVFQAIADPTRREIIDMIAKNSMNLNAVAANFHISRPAVSKHIKILSECGLITVTNEGRERICEARLDNLHEVYNWTSHYRDFWEKKLDALGTYMDKQQANSGKSKTLKLKTKKSKL